MNKYRIAIYIRLSKESDKYMEESNSITMQRILLQNYVEKNFAEYTLSEFVDDGYTGTNFNRPGIQKLLDMVKDSRIDCIVVKDFSRFARDYIELGSYLEQIFPFMKVRFISVNDNYDSDNYKGGTLDLDINFKNLLYDLYSRDLSQKVRSSLAVRKEKGQYISANCPFGYEKSPNDRHMLLIEDDEAKIVRRIFALALKGYTSTEITKLFNKENVKTPIEFKIEKGKTKRSPKGEKFLWNNGTICGILRNRIYVGDIVQEKYVKDDVGGRVRIKPVEEWRIFYNHHEPIIEREVFDKIQNPKGIKREHKHKETHPLVGKAVCGCCNKNLRYRRSLNPYFSCQERYSNGLEACVKKVNAVYLEQYVLFWIWENFQGYQYDTLTKEVVNTYIKRIIIFDEKEIEIEWVM